MKLYQLFANMVDDPGPNLAKQVREAMAILSFYDGGVVDLLRGFREFVETTPSGVIQEIHGRTFDSVSAFYPYVGYHLFGDGNHRWIFLTGLREHYRVCGFSSANELPDHLSVMLRFLAKNEDEEEREELISLCIIPALQRMLEGFGQKGNPYRGVLEALLLLLRPEESKENKTVIREYGIQKCV